MVKAKKIQEWEISVNPKGETAEIVIVHGLQSGKKITTCETITKGKNAGKANATTAFAQAAKEAEARWQKQQARRHYSLDATGKVSANKRGKAPMLAKSFEKFQHQVPIRGTFALQPKFDGYRCNAHWDAEEESVTLVSREGLVFNTMPHIVKAVKAMLRGTPSIILDGELWTPELRFSKIASAVKNKNNPPAWVPQIQYHLYDLISDSMFPDRFGQLKKLLADGDSSILVPSATLFVTSDGETDQEELIKQIKNYERQCVEKGLEGAMYRNCYHGYEAGKRSQNLLKVKSFIDKEFKVVGWKPGKLTQMLSSTTKQVKYTTSSPVSCPLPGNEIGEQTAVPIFICEMSPGGDRFEALAPGTVKEKKAFMADIDKWIGKKLTVKYFELTDDGVPRFPVAKCFR